MACKKGMDPAFVEIMEELAGMRRTMKVMQTRAKDAARIAREERKRIDIQSERHHRCFRKVCAGLRDERNALLLAHERQLKHEHDSWRRAQQAQALERQKARQRNACAAQRLERTDAASTKFSCVDDPSQMPTQGACYPCTRCGRTFSILMHLLVHRSSGRCRRTTPKSTKDRDPNPPQCRYTQPSPANVEYAPPRALRGGRHKGNTAANAPELLSNVCAGYATYHTRFRQPPAEPEPERESESEASCNGNREKCADSFVSAYDVLGIESSATDVEIRKAVRRRLLETHPDKNLGDSTGAQKRFIIVQEARRLLEDPTLRRQLDVALDEVRKESMEQGHSRHPIHVS